MALCEHCKKVDVTYSLVCALCARSLSRDERQARVTWFVDHRSEDYRKYRVGFGALGGIGLLPFVLVLTPDFSKVWYLDVAGYGFLSILLGYLIFNADGVVQQLDREELAKHKSKPNDDADDFWAVAPPNWQAISSWTYHATTSEPQIGLKGRDLYLIHDMIGLETIPLERIIAARVDYRESTSASRTVSETTKSDAVGRAMLGHFVAGTEGAIVGALSANETTESRTEYTMRATCELILKVEDEADPIRLIAFKPNDRLLALEWEARISQLVAKFRS